MILYIPSMDMNIIHTLQVSRVRRDGRRIESTCMKSASGILKHAANSEQLLSNCGCKCGLSKVYLRFCLFKCAMSIYNLPFHLYSFTW
jgi:hypothetical protein